MQNIIVYLCLICQVILRSFFTAVCLWSALFCWTCAALSPPSSVCTSLCPSPHTHLRRSGSLPSPPDSSCTSPSQTWCVCNNWAKINEIANIYCVKWKWRALWAYAKSSNIRFNSEESMFFEEKKSIHCSLLHFSSKTNI